MLLYCSFSKVLKEQKSKKRLSLILYIKKERQTCGYNKFHHNQQDMLPSRILLTLIINSYKLLLLVSPVDSMQCLHRAEECEFLLVG